MQAKNFFILGSINFLITHLLLQISLLFLPIWLSTFISQFNNFILGFFMYGKLVFKKKRLTNKIAFKYLLIAIISWILNTLLIYLISYFTGLKEGYAAITVIPIIIIYSFLSQKYFVFIK